MNLRVKIYTTSRVLESDLASIKATVALSPGIIVETIDVEEVSKIKDAPTADGGGFTMIDWDWIRRTYPASGYNAVCLHITRKESSNLGLTHPDPNAALGGVYSGDSDGVFDFVVIANAGQKSSHPNVSEFERIFLHELSHGFYHWRNMVDFTHTWDYVMKNLRAPYLTHDFTIWNSLKAQLESLKKTLASMQQKLHRPLDEQFMERVSYPFGVPDTSYAATKHHVGVDWSVPNGEPCYALADSTVTGVYKNHAQLGNAVQVEFTHEGRTYTARYLHLSRVMPGKTFKRGEIVGYTGSTGQSTGPHLHLDIVRGKFNLTGINHKNFRDKFVDPLTLIGKG